MRLSNFMNKYEKLNSCKLRLINITANLSVRVVHHIKVSILCHEHLSAVVCVYVYVCVCVYIYICVCVCVCVCEPSSSVGIATDYGLDGPGSNSGGDNIFRPSKPALVPTQSPVQWVPDISRE